MNQKKRIVLTTMGSLGDLHPYLALARELKSRGHSPVIATSDSYREKVEADGIEFAVCRPSMSDFGDSSQQLRKVNHSIFGTIYVIRRLVRWLRESFADLDAISANADLIMAHPLSYAAPIVAERRQIPWVGTLLQPMGFLSAFDPPVLPVLGRLPFGPGINRQIFSAVRWVGRNWLEEVRKLRAEQGLPPMAMDPFLGTLSPWLTLGLFSPLLGSPQPDWPQPTKVTGFVFYDEGAVAYERPDPRLEPFLLGGPAPIVFTLGSSVVKTAGTFFSESIEAARRLQVRAIVVTGREAPEPHGLPPGILAVPYVPYGFLFPKACLIVHHGGAGTTGQALKAGKPQLVVPKAHDQPDHAARIARLGCGDVLSRSRYRAATVAAELSRLLADTRIAQTAQRVSEAVRAERGARSAADELEKLALAR
jgi:rhamnosyltransferase subunit B